MAALGTLVFFKKDLWIKTDPQKQLCRTKDFDKIFHGRGFSSWYFDLSNQIIPFQKIPVPCHNSENSGLTRLLKEAHPKKKLLEPITLGNIGHDDPGNFSTAYCCYQLYFFAPFIC